MKLETRVLQNLTQQQKLSQRQQQDLKILEMNNQDLESWIEEELEKNPLLEFDEAYETGAASCSQGDFDLLLNFVTNEQTLTDVLQEQIDTCLHPLPKELAEFIINSLDGNGYLPLTDEEIHKLMPHYNLDEIEDTINEIQTFEPAGVCARNLQECLLIQLCFEDIPYSQIAIMIVNFYLKEVSENKLPQIAEALQIPLADVQHAITLIRSLDPKPGSRYAHTSAYVNPDMQVDVEDGEIHIQMFRKNYGLRIQTPVDTGTDAEAARYLNQQKKQAESLLGSIEKRNSTIARIMEVIAIVQQDFFLHHGQLKPLNMKDIAARLTLHESTISRAVSGKSILFEQQIIPLKFFFPSRVSEDASANEIHLRLRTLIDQEDKKKPYSDQKLCDLLKEDGLDVSRRTIAKYRDQLKIPAASKRKQF